MLIALWYKTPFNRSIIFLFKYNKISARSKLVYWAHVYSYFKKVAPVIRDAWSMFHSPRRTNLDSYGEREFQAGNK